MISLHTSPLDQPGTGDAGGMNVYVLELAKRLAAHGVEIDIFTRATSSALPPQVAAYDGVTVRHVHAGPFEGLTKQELPAQLCAFAREVLRVEAAHPVGHYDLVHSHYWLSGQVGALARDRWGVPLVHTMHTMAKVKNAALADGDAPEPAARIIGEEQVVEAADMLIGNTDAEAKQLINLYDADPGRVEVVYPGVDLTVFAPRDKATARAELGLPQDAAVLMFAGRIQPLKAPDVLLRAVAVLLERHPELRSRLVVPGVGAFAACMAGIEALGAGPVIAERVAAGRPVLGICVGMQILFGHGEEHGVVTKGLGLLPGGVSRLPARRLPHMGWNTVRPPAGSTLFAGLPEGTRFYFVHSYGVTDPAALAEAGATVTTAHHGTDFVAAVERGALSAAQFHPEKSADAGAALLRNWLGTL